MRIGIALPNFANPGVPYFRTPDWEQLELPPMQEVIRLGEELGYDSLWVADHMFLGRHGAITEGWTTLAWAAGATSRMRLGTIHLGNGFRHPPLAAKMAATLDWLTGGRLEWFVEPGWRAREHVSYGFDYEHDRAIRTARMAEAIDLTRRLWTGERVSYEGQFYRLEDAICQPTPKQEGGPRIWLGEALDEATVELTARHADVWNSIPAGEKLLAEKMRRVDEACERHGRDPSTLSRSLETQVLIVDSERELDAFFDRYADLRDRHPAGDAMTDVIEFLREINPDLDSLTEPHHFREEFVMGTSEQVLEKLSRYRDMGVEEIICWFMDFPSTESLRRLAAEVMPKLREETGVHG